MAVVVMIRLRKMTAIEATGFHALEEVAKKLQSSGRTIILCGGREQAPQFDASSRIRRSCGPGKISAPM